MVQKTWKAARKIVVGVVGATILLAGVALIVLPGPAILVIPLGLGILAAEFDWARRWLNRIRKRSGDSLDRMRTTA